MSADREVVIRWGIEDDDAALLRIERTSWSPESGFPSYLEGLGDRFFERTGPESHLIAECAGVVVGYLRLQDKYQFREGNGVLAVNGLAVAPEARGRGVAAALLAAAAYEGRRRDARKISLNVHSTNLVARRLYERHGYVVEGTLADEFVIDGRPIAALVMAKTL
ncbi:GNAT family N-acetyltransferase [Kribbella sandramycini]|uniref:Ribosomal protein S18 acetylase RimI-like enzyme n=1 Tax=Kribbella sandramycini TaxID=60450 RepID=A0A841S777_9ACTN|nr:ribosomal protein S18 acetylase RimI-like enzyme [Kribbella sandramycini]